MEIINFLHKLNDIELLARPTVLMFLSFSFNLNLQFHFHVIQLVDGVKKESNLNAYKVKCRGFDSRGSEATQFTWKFMLST
jgi:hypothetical protein